MATREDRRNDPYNIAQGYADTAYPADSSGADRNNRISTKYSSKKKNPNYSENPFKNLYEFQKEGIRDLNKEFNPFREPDVVTPYRMQPEQGKRWAELENQGLNSTQVFEKMMREGTLTEDIMSGYTFLPNTAKAGFDRLNAAAAHNGGESFNEKVKSEARNEAIWSKPKAEFLPDQYRGSVYDPEAMNKFEEYEGQILQDRKDYEQRMLDAGVGDISQYTDYSLSDSNLDRMREEAETSRMYRGRVPMGMTVSDGNLIGVGAEEASQSAAKQSAMQQPMSSQPNLVGNIGNNASDYGMLNTQELQSPTSSGGVNRSYSAVGGSQFNPKAGPNKTQRTSYGGGNIGYGGGKVPFGQG